MKWNGRRRSAREGECVQSECRPSRIMAGGGGGEALLWEGAAERASALLWGRDTNSEMLLFASDSGLARVWWLRPSDAGVEWDDVEISGTVPLLCAAWHSAERAAFLGCADGEVVRWDLAAGERQACARHRAPVTAMQWCEQANALAVGAADGAIALLDARARRERPALSFGAADALRTRLVSLDARESLLAALPDTRALSIFDVRRAAQPLLRLELQLLGAPLAASFLPPELTAGVCVSSNGGDCVIWLPSQTRWRLSVGDGLRCGVALHPSAAWLAAATTDGAVGVWDYQAGARVSRVAAREGAFAAAVALGGHLDLLATVYKPSSNASLARVTLRSLADQELPLRRYRPPPLPPPKPPPPMPLPSPPAAAAAAAAAPVAARPEPKQPSAAASAAASSWSGAGRDAVNFAALAPSPPPPPRSSSSSSSLRDSASRQHPSPPPPSPPAAAAAAAHSRSSSDWGSPEAAEAAPAFAPPPYPDTPPPRYEAPPEEEAAQAAAAAAAVRSAADLWLMARDVALEATRFALATAAPPLRIAGPRRLYVGPRGGVYYYSANGNKVYVQS